MHQLRVRVKKLVQLQGKKRIRKKESLQDLQKERRLRKLVLQRQARQILCQKLQLSQSISVSFRSQTNNQKLLERRIGKHSSP